MRALTCDPAAARCTAAASSGACLRAVSCVPESWTTLVAVCPSFDTARVGPVNGSLTDCTSGPLESAYRTRANGARNAGSRAVCGGEYGSRVSVWLGEWMAWTRLLLE